MKTYWRIVPRKDGTTYLGKDNENYLLISKANDTFDNTLLFEDCASAKDYILKYLDYEKYVEEWTYLDEKYYGLK